MPNWTTDEILAVHMRMHKAEGVLFREALAASAESCGLSTVRLPMKQLDEYEASELALPLTKLKSTIASMGKAAGPPWGKDQKEAARAAIWLREALTYRAETRK